MREIKFRSIVLNTPSGVRGKWVYGYPQQMLSDRVLDTNELVEIRYIHEHQTDLKKKGSFGKLVHKASWRIDPTTLGQYTGLKDKNGNEIYEGDILHGLYGFSTETAVVVRNYCKWSILHGDAYYDPIHRDIGEVVGNIHENPELMLT